MTSMTPPTVIRLTTYDSNKAVLRLSQQKQQISKSIDIYSLSVIPDTQLPSYNQVGHRVACGCNLLFYKRAKVGPRAISGGAEFLDLDWKHLVSRFTAFEPVPEEFI